MQSTIVRALESSLPLRSLVRQLIPGSLSSSSSKFFYRRLRTEEPQRPSLMGDRFRPVDVAHPFRFPPSSGTGSGSGDGQEQEDDSRRRQRVRKMGILLAGAGSGSWSYGEIRKRSKLLQREHDDDDEEEGPDPCDGGSGGSGGSGFARGSGFAGIPSGPFTVRAATAVNSKGLPGESPAVVGGASSRRGRFNFIAEVVEETASALVYIEIKDLGVRDFFSGQPATSSNGSGFVVKEDGLILTNAHVVINKPRASVQVRLQDGRSFVGVVESVDVKSDLATVRIPAKNLPVMKLGKSSDVKPGEFVIAMGSPLSLSNTITTGVVSSVARNRKELGLKSRDVPDYIQTDAAINFGNSGGPLINLDGEAIGINSMKVTTGISFAIPIDYAKEFLQKTEEEARHGKGRPLQHGHPAAPGSGDLQALKRRYMGITMFAINNQLIDELRAKLQIPPHVVHGILVFRIVAGSPADRAGIMPGDIITHINGVQIFGSGDVYRFLEGSDEILKITIARRSEVLEVHVRPEH